MSSTFPKVALKGFKYYAGMSQETYCFNATVTFDGVPVMTAENCGRGGPTNLRQLLGKQTSDEFSGHVKTLESIHDSDKEKYPYDFEKAQSVVDHLVQFEILKRNLIRRMKTRTILTQKGKKGIFELTRMWIPEDRSRLPSVDIIFNELPIDEAVEKYIQIEKELPKT
jgi:hypothetical protein